jgi:4,5-DOPA dioxygenase extradiol
MKAVNQALRSSDTVDATIGLFHHPFYKSAHPTPEHLLPLVVAVAATSKGDKLEEIYFECDGLGWGMWRWKM